MKKTLLTIGIAIASYCSYAQNAPLYIWGTGLDGSTYQTAAIYSDATNGLLIEAPLNSVGAKLPISLSWRGSGTPFPFMISPSGNVGIGTTSPGYKLDVGGNSRLLNANPEFMLQSSTSGAGNFSIGTGYNGIGNKKFYIYNNTSGTASFVIDDNGNTGIGTTDPQGYKLAVNGSAIAESITVKLHGSWPDYVFKSKYNLLSLTAVKAYIDKNQHLPDMPSEQEVAKNGINLGEIVKVQTKKIEELTLYLIEKDKEVKEDRNRIAALEAVLGKLTSSNNSK